MTTNFGKLLRRLRVDKDITMRSMAQSMKISPSYISGIENGKYEVSDNFLNTLFKTFNIKGQNQNEYKEASKNNLSTINFDNNSSLISALARRDLTEQELNQLRQLIENKENKVNDW